MLSKVYLILFSTLLLFSLTAIFPVLEHNIASAHFIKYSWSIRSELFFVDWSSCVTSSNFPYSRDSHPPLALGFLAQLNCPAVLDLYSTSESRKELSEINAFWVGYALVRDGQHQAAVDIWKEQPVPIGSYLMALAFQNREALDKVQNLTDLATSVEPANWKLWVDRGTLLTNTEPELARVAFQKAVVLAPSIAKAYLELGLLAVKQGDYVEAIKQCQWTTQIEPDNLLGWLCLGRSAFYAQKWDLAENAFSTRLELKPHDPETLFWMGRTARYRGKNEQAVILLTQAIQNESEKESLIAHTWHELGLAFLSLERKREAVEAFQNALASDPNFIYIDQVKNELLRLGFEWEAK